MNSIEILHDAFFIFLVICFFKVIIDIHISWLRFKVLLRFNRHESLIYKSIRDCDSIEFLHELKQQLDNFCDTSKKLRKDAVPEDYRFNKISSLYNQYYNKEKMLEMKLVS